MAVSAWGRGSEEATMPIVETVRGPVRTGELGSTLMHEHIFVLTPDLAGDGVPEVFDEQARVDDAVAKLRELVALGVRTIVDPTVIGLGRDIPRIQRVNEQVPELNIVVATGIYTYRDLPHYFDLFGPGRVLGGDDPMPALFVRDITEGIAGTGVKAGLLKCAVDAPGLVEPVERVLRAVAAAHRETGTPITVHTSVGNDSPELVQRVLKEEGVDLDRVVLGHVGDSTDLGRLKSLADAGGLLGMDRFGLDLYCPTDQRVATIAALCADGYAQRMVLAHDASCHIDWIPDQVREAAMPNWHYRHISQDVLPALREHGVTDEQITTMMVDNPRRYFSAASEQAASEQAASQQVGAR
jgi:phosphotriesterase-related protein